MATESKNDSTASNSTNSTTSKNFIFRPSALSDVADKIWKSTTTTESNVSGTDTQPQLFSGFTLSSSGNGANPFLNRSTGASSAFIFGKNISTRVVKDSSDQLNPENGSEKHSSEPSNDQQKDEENKDPPINVSFDTLAATSTTTDSVSSANGQTSTTTSTSETPSSVQEETGAAGLEESAAAYELAKNQIQKQPNLLAPEEVKTGEEDEMNMVQASVKLFVFDTNKKSWTDRGLAIMRVNDRRSTVGDWDEVPEETRIVVRLQGSLRVIVNTKLWPEMLLERVSPKRLRLSGTVEDAAFSGNDAGQAQPISIYLVSASQSADIDRIERTLRDRLDRLKHTEQESATSTRKRPASPGESTSTSNDGDASRAKKRELDQQSDK